MARVDGHGQCPFLTLAAICVRERPRFRNVSNQTSSYSACVMASSHLPPHLPILLLSLILAITHAPPHSVAHAAIFDNAQSTTLQSLVHRWLHWGSVQTTHHDQADAVGGTAHLRLPPAPRHGGGDPGAAISGAATSNLSLTYPLSYSVQMMHRPEVDLIASYLRPTDVYLEYGVGGSTLNFVPLVARAYAVEHNCEWATHMANVIQKQQHPQAYAHLRIKCVSIAPGFRGWGTLSSYEHANYRQFREYVDVVDSLAEPYFDKVFVDGRARTCLVHSPPPTPHLCPTLSPTNTHKNNCFATRQVLRAPSRYCPI